MADRFTGIEPDQLQDNSLTPSEFKSSNNPSLPLHLHVLTWDNINQIMKWQYLFGNRIIK